MRNRTLFGNDVGALKAGSPPLRIQAAIVLVLLFIVTVMMAF